MCRHMAYMCCACDMCDLHVGTCDVHVIYICCSQLFAILYTFNAGEHLDILAISCDSFSEVTNMEIGRRQGTSNHLDSLNIIREWCRSYRVAFKINSVINTHNWEEDMGQEIRELDPVRWKVH